jgi:4-amino-4-deoxy-L-arabinose transferase-like glycosyltransferase
MTRSNRSVPPKIILLFLVAWLLLVYDLGAPWAGSQARVWVPSAVRNYRMYGLETTKLMMIRNEVPTTPENFTYYSHHPPLIVWMPAVTTIFLGENELAVRFGFVSVSLISVAAMYLLSRRLYGEKMAIWAAAFYACVPIIAYYGHIPGFAQMALAVSLLFAAMLVNWLRRPTRARLCGLALLAWAAVWVAWDAVFFVGALGLVALRVANKEQRIAIVGLGVVTVMSLVTLLVFYQLQWSGSFDSLMDAFVWRSSTAKFRADSESFTIPHFLFRNLVHVFVLATPPFFVVSVWGIRPIRRYGSTLGNTILVGLFLGAVLYYLVFRNASFVHSYYKATLVPSMALTAAAACVYARAGRFSRPVIDGLLFGIAVFSVWTFAVMYRFDHRPWLDEIQQTINTIAEPDDVLLSNLDFLADVQVVQFYTKRAIEQEIAPEDALTRAAETENRVLYFYCDSEEHTLPEVLQDHEHQPLYDNGSLCVMYVME